MYAAVMGETSGRIRDALLRRGHQAWSIDLLPGKTDGPHIQGNAFDYFECGWNAMIAHPDCTKLTVAAAWCMYHPDDKDLPREQRRPHPKFPNRRAEQDQAADDFMRFVNAPIPCKIIENPVGVMATRYRPADQYIQPYWFGDDASKLTGLWIYGLPPLAIPPPSPLASGSVGD